MYKKIGFWFLVFLVGGIAGVVFGQILLPQLASVSFLNKIDWIAKTRECTTIVNKTEKIYLTEDTAFQEIIGKIGNSVVAVRSEKRKIGGNEILTEGSGFILTGDGLIITAGNLAHSLADYFLVIKNGKEIEAKLLKRDEQNNLALLKIEETNLPVVGLGDSGNLKLGETVFLFGIDNKDFMPFINLGFVRSMNGDLGLSFKGSQLANGSPLMNIKGEVVGLNLIDKDGNIKVVFDEKIRELIK